jgi:UDP-GlcNAc:undecaprenyl-phosphate/decaprenyl-phosphate GlcNAc-1-phosphate transferase
MNTMNIHFIEFMPGWLIVFASFVSAFAVTYAGIPSIVAISRAKKLYDLPNSRDSHFVPTPLMGGVAVFAGLISGPVLSYGRELGSELNYIALGTTLLLFIGLKDDLLSIAPVKKMIVQIMSSLIIIVLGDIHITSFYGILGISELPYLISIPFTLFVFTLIINAINLIDGIDGLASAVAIIISVTLGLWFLGAGIISYSVVSFALAGSLFAFIRFNVFSKKNKIFLGDTGSLVIGIVVAVIAVRFLQFDVFIKGSFHLQSAPAIITGILIYPLFDTLRVFILRVLQGRSPFSADHQHIHHRLLKSGYTHRRATLIVASFNIVVIIISFLFRNQGIFLLLLFQVTLALVFLRFTAINIRAKSHPVIIVPRFLKIVDNKEFSKNKRAI